MSTIPDIGVADIFGLDCISVFERKCTTILENCVYVKKEIIML